MLNLDITIPSPATLKNRIIEKVLAVEDAIKKKLLKHGKFGYILDGWSNKNRQGYLAVKVY